MTPTVPDNTVRFAIPKGRMEENVVRLLGDAGIGVSSSARGYRPVLSIAGFQTKLLKPRAIVEMLATGARDLGFAGADWVAETGVDLVELLDTGLDPVRLVAAAPASLLREGELPRQPLVVASEYERLTKGWVERAGVDASFLRSHGATEVLPPEDADCVVDNTATGSTLAANGLTIIDELMTSSTRLYASPAAMESPAKRESIARFVMVVGAVLEARRRVMVEVNVSAADLDGVVAALPCMREPTVSPLRSSGGFAVKAAVPREALAGVIPELKRRGGTDVIVTAPGQIVP